MVSLSLTPPFAVWNLEPIRSGDGARSEARDPFEPFKNMGEVSDQGRGAHSSSLHYHLSYNRTPASSFLSTLLINFISSMRKPLSQVLEFLLRLRHVISYSS